MGPPCEGGHLLIRSPRVDSGDDRGSPGGGTRRTGDTGGDNARVLRLAVSIKAGPPAKVLIRSPALGVEEFSSEIRTTQLAGFKVGGCCNGWVSRLRVGCCTCCWGFFVVFSPLKLEVIIIHISLVSFLCLSEKYMYGKITPPTRLFKTQVSKD